MAQERKRRPPGHGFQQQRDRERYARARGSDSPNWRKDPSPSPPQPYHHHPSITRSHRDNAFFLHQWWTKFVEDKSSPDRPSAVIEVTPEPRPPSEQTHPSIDLDAWLQAQQQS